MTFKTEFSFKKVPFLVITNMLLYVQYLLVVGPKSSNDELH